MFHSKIHYYFKCTFPFTFINIGSSLLLPFRRFNHIVPSTSVPLFPLSNDGIGLFFGNLFFISPDNISRVKGQGGILIVHFLIPAISILQGSGPHTLHTWLWLIRLSIWLKETRKQFFDWFVRISWNTNHHSLLHSLESFRLLTLNDISMYTFSSNDSSSSRLPL